MHRALCIFAVSMLAATTYSAAATDSFCRLGSVTFSGPICRTILEGVSTVPQTFRAEIKLSIARPHFVSCEQELIFRQKRSLLFIEPHAMRDDQLVEALNGELDRDNSLAIDMLASENLVITIKIYLDEKASRSNPVVLFPQGGNFYELSNSAYEFSPDRRELSFSLFARLSDLCEEPWNYILVFDDHSHQEHVFLYDEPFLLGYAKFSSREVAAILERRRILYRDRSSDLANQ